MLAGTLADFGLKDVFQLLSLTRKSGSLCVTTEAGEGRVYFRGGEVCFAVADVRRLPLGARLVSAGKLTHEDLESVVESRRGTSAVDLARALVELRADDPGTIDALVLEQVHEAVFALIRREQGNFQFDGEVDTESWNGPSTTTDELIAECTRRLADWQRVQEHIPSPNAIPWMHPNAGGRDGDITLPSEQWHVLALVDGRRSVGDIVDLTGHGEFATCALLANLVGAGLVEMSDPANGGRTALAEMVDSRETLRRLEDVASGAKPATIPGLPHQGVSRGRTPAVGTASASSGARPSRPAAERLTVRANGAEADSPDESERAGADDPRPPAAERSPAGAPVAELGPEEVPIQPARAENVAAPSLNRAQVARELASLGIDDLTGARKPVAPEGEGDGDVAPSGIPRQLTRDEDLNKGLLFRLIDGVKGA